ncbi:hypothetical protein ACS0ZG_37680 [Burkholderia gladioli]|uniref:hypothetical protein n=1 Tax=Burkholderia gladioli TaxID=28095 RepID=UPI0016419FB7|nr:hypothetical protein [Burkholderia gladioli]
MQESTVSLGSGEAEFRLSGELSEWLFSSSSEYFWSKFNDAHGTLFDQFEDEIVDPSIINSIAIELGGKISDLEKLKIDELEFVYRWTQDRKPITAKVAKVALIFELTRLRQFLWDAAKTGNVATFSL